MKKSYAGFLFATVLFVSSGFSADNPLEIKVDVNEKEISVNEKKDNPETTMSVAKKWGWRIAQVAGAVALVGLVAYQMFASPTIGIEKKPFVIDNQDIFSDVESVKPEDVKPAQSVTDVPLHRAFSLLPQQQQQPLTKEQIRRYKALRTEFGLSALTTGSLVWAGWIHPLFTIPVLMYGTASAYYGMKALPTNNTSVLD